MISARRILLASVATGMIFMFGCTPGDDPSSAAQPTEPAASATVTTSAPSAEADSVAATKAACAAVEESVAATLKRVAEAEKVGPPEGHLDVSLGYAVGVGAIYHHSFTSSDQVSHAINNLVIAMGDLAEAWEKGPEEAPSTAEFSAAHKRLKEACEAG